MSPCAIRYIINVEHGLETEHVVVGMCAEQEWLRPISRPFCCLLLCVCTSLQQAGREGEEGVGSSVWDGEERGQRRGDRRGAGEGETLLPTEHVWGQRSHHLTLHRPFSKPYSIQLCSIFSLLYNIYLGDYLFPPWFFLLISWKVTQGRIIILVLQMCRVHSDWR